jgi:hypothetical protein
MERAEWTTPVEALLEDARREPIDAIDPERVWDMCDDTPYDAMIGFAADTARDEFDVVLRRRRPAAPLVAAGVVLPLSSASRHPWSVYTNDRLRSERGSSRAPALRQCLRERLPEYMMPSAIKFLKALPLTRSGKVDRRALMLRESPEDQPSAAYVPAATAVERLLVSMWQDVLGLERVGVNDNFFDIGGHSLLLVRLHSRLRRVVARELSVIDLFRYPTIRALVNGLSLEDSVRAASVDRVDAARPPLVAKAASGSFHKDGQS